MVEEPPWLCPWGTMRVLPYVPEDQGPYFNSGIGSSGSN